MDKILISDDGGGICGCNCFALPSNILNMRGLQSSGGIWYAFEEPLDPRRWTRQRVAEGRT